MFKTIMSLSLIIPVYNEVNQIEFSLKKLNNFKKYLKNLKLYLLMTLAMMVLKKKLRVL